MMADHSLSGRDDFAYNIAGSAKHEHCRFTMVSHCTAAAWRSLLISYISVLSAGLEYSCYPVLMERCLNEDVESFLYLDAFEKCS